MRALVPEDLSRNGHAAREAGMRSFVRSCLCVGLSALDKSVRPGDIARRWEDRAVGLVLRAAVSPTSLANTPALATIAVAFLEALRPMSAGADLLARGVALNFAGAAQITVPGIAVPTASFVAEGNPIPVVTAPTSAGPTLSPHKLAVITTLTGELMRGSNAETLLRQVLLESTGPALDAVLFSNAAATADAPVWWVGPHVPGVYANTEPVRLVAELGLPLRMRGAPNHEMLMNVS
jgi:hypothetical protein